jgi:hypothetical protein
MSQNESLSAGAEGHEAPKLSYHSPQLREVGSLRDLTEAAPAGSYNGDSSTYHSG